MVIKYLRAMGHLTKSLTILNCFMLSLISVMLSWSIGNCLLSLFIISWFLVMVAAGLLKHGFLVLFLCLCCYGFVKPVDCMAYLLVVSIQIKCGIASLFWFYFCSVYFIKLLKGISKSLGLEEWYIDKAMNMDSSLQVLIANLYPPCPQPEYALGLSFRSWLPHPSHWEWSWGASSGAQGQVVQCECHSQLLFSQHRWPTWGALLLLCSFYSLLSL